MLKYIVENKGRELTYSEIHKKFHVAQQEVEEKMQQLSKTDLVINDYHNHRVIGIADEVMETVLTKINYTHLFPNMNKEELAQHLDQMARQKLVWEKIKQSRHKAFMNPDS